MSTDGNKTRVLLGWPWYDGPDKNTFGLYHEITHYFGRLQERSMWLTKYGDDNEVTKDRQLDVLSGTGDTEITAADGEFEFGYQDVSGISLVGMAREKIISAALDWGADYVFMWDDDMRFPWSAFLKMYRHQKPVVNALAFTGNEPIWPCLWSVSVENGEYYSKVVYDYPENALITDEDVDGVIAFGSAVSLYNMNVFRRIHKPWFHSTGFGEDFMFCMRCHENGIRAYVDTSIKVQHLMKTPRWADEDKYKKDREAFKDFYKEQEEKQDNGYEIWKGYRE